MNPERIDNRLDERGLSADSLNPEARTPVQTGNKIKHVFVLMLENRSFDHMMAGLRIPGVIGAALGDSDPRFSNQFGGATYTVSSPAKDPISADPAHEFPDTLQQLCNTVQNPFPKGPYPQINNAGFVANYAKVLGVTGPDSRLADVMACCTPQQVPVLYKLATEFAVCDQFFSSVPGPTMPNRLFAMGASACGMDRSNDWVDVSNWYFRGFEYIKGSIFDRPGIRWRGYFDSHYDPPGHAKVGSIPMATFLHGVHSWHFAYMQNRSSVLNPYAANPPFTQAVKDPNYPYNFIWIEPNYGHDFEPGTGSSQHPRDTLAAGEQLIATVYNALRSSPLWNDSLLIITWDEHGGFYDHVHPPATVPPGDGTRFANGPYHPGYHFDFAQLGVRVPAIVVSPRIRKGTVDHTVYDHSSILKTVEEIFSIPSLTARDRAANSLSRLISTELRNDCPLSVVANKPHVVRPILTVRDQEPMPADAGLLYTFLLAAMKNETELPGGNTTRRTRNVELENELRAIRTRGDARTFLDNVVADMYGPFVWGAQLPGLAREIAVGSDGSVWLIGTDYGAYRRDGTGWNKIDDNHLWFAIAVGPDGQPWTADQEAGNIYRRQEGSWVQLPGAGRDIAVGADGSVWIVGTNRIGNDYGIYKWNAPISNWNMIDGGGIRIAVGPDGVPWLVNAAGQIFRRQEGVSWSLLPGLARDIGVGANGSVWILGTNQLGSDFGIYKWNDAISNWDQADGAGTRIAVGPDGLPWLVNAAGQIFHAGPSQ